MKKIFLLCMILFLVNGCTKIKDSNIDTLINETLISKISSTNVNRNGYKYYLPKGLYIKSSKTYNEILSNHKYMLYLYIDIVSYNNKTEFSYTINSRAFYSKDILYNGIKGYIEINKYKNDKYLIEIMYNYAKIEVIVLERDIKEIVTYASTILSSITYNDNVIEKYLSSNVYDSVEEDFDIFKIVGSDNFLQFADEEDKQDEVKDPDYIK